MNIPNELPLLASGSHSRGSGKACIMNAISYINGDTKITDMPSCSYYVLAKAAIRLNDQICDHRKDGVLCSDCSHVMWMIGSRIIGTADVIAGWTGEQKRRLAVQLALREAVRVEHLVSPESASAIKACNLTVQAWVEGKATRSDVAGARTAAAAAASAAAAAAAAADATAANAADAARRSRIASVDQLIDHFEELTGSLSQRTWSSVDSATVRDGARIEAAL